MKININIENKSCELLSIKVSFVYLVNSLWTIFFQPINCTNSVTMQLPIAFVIFFILIIVNAQSDFNEICSSFSGRRIYLDDNGSGYIQAANITTSNLQNVRINLIFLFKNHFFNCSKGKKNCKIGLTSKNLFKKKTQQINMHKKIDVCSCLLLFKPADIWIIFLTRLCLKNLQ